MEDNDYAAIIFANLRRKKKKPSGVLKFAEACRHWVNKLGSYNEAARYFKASRTIITQLDKINDLTPEAKELVEEAGIDRSYQVSRLELNKQADVLREVVDLNANPDARLFVDFLLEYPDTPIAEAKRKFLKLHPKTEKVHIIALPLTSETYHEIYDLATRKGMIVHDLILSLVEEYITNAEKKAKK